MFYYQVTHSLIWRIQHKKMFYCSMNKWTEWVMSWGNLCEKCRPRLVRLCPVSLALTLINVYYVIKQDIHQYLKIHIRYRQVAIRQKRSKPSVEPQLHYIGKASQFRSGDLEPATLGSTAGEFDTDSVGKWFDMDIEFGRVLCYSIG